MSDVISVPVTLIRSFKFRTTCYITLHEVPATTTLSHLFDLIEKAVRESPNVPPPFKTMHFDCSINTWIKGQLRMVSKVILFSCSLFMTWITWFQLNRETCASPTSRRSGFAGVRIPLMLFL
ncbi:unnamed protein product [Dicrocoelium dendriticum]|nr:unnamed protein product [Dicrocoelium dendriticum]